MSKRVPVKPPAPIGEVHTQTCRHCSGSGEEPGMSDLTCRECFGRGRQKWRVDLCKSCGGSGKSKKFLGLFKCDACEGKGWSLRDIA